MRAIGQNCLFQCGRQTFQGLVQKLAANRLTKSATGHGGGCQTFGAATHGMGWPQKLLGLSRQTIGQL